MRTKFATVVLGITLAAASFASTACDLQGGAGTINPSQPSTTPGAVKKSPQELAKERQTAQVGSTRQVQGVQSGTPSNNWSGELENSDTPDTYQGVAGEWTVPYVQATDEDHYSCTWIGVDGWSGVESLIQTGTEEDSVDGQAQYYGWMETLPDTQSRITYDDGTAATVKPGDVMWSYVYRVSGNQWVVYLQDITQNWTFNQTREYASPGQSVEWVHEATQVNGLVDTPPIFSSVTFTSLEILQGGKWYYTTLNQDNEVDLIQDGITYAHPDDPTGNPSQEFTVSYG